LANLTGAIVEICRSGLGPDALRDAVLARLRRAVPFDAAFFSTVDPTTLLFTQPYQEEIPASTIPYFVRNELLEDDVNKWTALARTRPGVRSLAQATAGDLAASARFRDVFAPLGLGDELRAVLRAGGACWGYVCLHRETGARFTKEEMRYVNRVAPHVAEGIRLALLVAAVEAPGDAAVPGLIVVGADGGLVSMTEGGERWCAELGAPAPARDGVPVEVAAVAARARHPDPGGAPARLRVATRSGRWAVLHAAPLVAGEAESVAVIIEEASPSELAPVLMLAYRLTRAEQALAALVCRGLSTDEMARELHITPYTVQDHLKSIFEKTGVRGRRELVATILREQYLPRAHAGDRVAPSGFFAPGAARPRC
jgi:DNA-binding CsgD family transcriptional regulator